MTHKQRKRQTQTGRQSGLPIAQCGQTADAESHRYASWQ